MNKEQLLSCELSNWDKFLVWLKKINCRAFKQQNKALDKQQEVKKNNKFRFSQINKGITPIIYLSLYLFGDMVYEYRCKEVYK